MFIRWQWQWRSDNDGSWWYDRVKPLFLSVCVFGWVSLSLTRHFNWTEWLNRMKQSIHVHHHSYRCCWRRHRGHLTVAPRILASITRSYGTSLAEIVFSAALLRSYRGAFFPSAPQIHFIVIIIIIVFLNFAFLSTKVFLVARCLYWALCAFPTKHSFLILSFSLSAWARVCERQRETEREKKREWELANVYGLSTPAP